MADEKTSALDQARHRLAAIIVELDAGAAHGDDALTAARLAPDMLPLSAQVGTVCDMAGQLARRRRASRRTARCRDDHRAEGAGAAVA